jgi:hypothetical protein
LIDRSPGAGGKVRAIALNVAMGTIRAMAERVTGDD